ncbi:hypothetical protein TSUD_413220 [Trifolium subterraneum]|uniref:Replication protein A 70 kDa DNA-binding subunit B/D first OB fold domain-containing protein n=1 Tax=Trifolium subterraneum TaxID=3900 RepID=A0A2Z6P4Q7_TRISU|nr:hypothetical protein TSUD_413220 [Trifolium subterraneum]
MSLPDEVVFGDIIQANPRNAGVVYEVRVLRKWSVIDRLHPERVESVNMVFVDEHNHKIQATIPSDLISVFDHQLVEKNVYQVWSLSIDFNFDSLLPCHHRYKFIFNRNSKVIPSDNPLLPTYGLSLISADSVHKKRLSQRYMVDVVGVVTAVQHDKNFFPDGKVTQSVTFQMNEQRSSFECELSGNLVEEFRKSFVSSVGGLPIVVLQFMKIEISQGCTLVEGLEGITRIFVDPSIADVTNFRNGMAWFLRRNILYRGLSPASTSVPMSHLVDFVRRYPVRTIEELKSNPELGVYFLNARISDVVDVETWWYPLCNCPSIFDGYIGAFFCQRCNVDKFNPAPKVKIAFELEDETGNAIFKAFDHVMISVASSIEVTRGVTIDQFYNAFASIVGKSIMFIVKKTNHDPNGVDSRFELVRVSDHETVIGFFTHTGYYKTPSRNVGKRVRNARRQVNIPISVPCTSTISDLVDEYLVAAAANFEQNTEVASTSRTKRTRD